MESIKDVLKEVPKVETSTDIYKKLLPYQHSHVDNIIKSLKKYKRALDASDTGTGKTYCSIAASKRLNLKPFIICPKSVIPDWFKVLKHFNHQCYGVANYELIKNCKYYKDNGMNKDKCPYVTSKTIVVDSKKSKAKNKKKKRVLFTWSLPKDCIIIFDESHKCKNNKTVTSDIMFTLSHYPNNILMLSATACDKPKLFLLFGYVLGLYESVSEGSNWLIKISKMYDMEDKMKAVHKVIFNEYGSRMNKKDVGDIFKKNTVIADVVDMNCCKEIQEEYKVIKEVLEDLKKKESQAEALAKIIYARQKIEMNKVPTFVKMIKDNVKKGFSVAMFVNFTDTLRKIGDATKCKCFIFGEQTLNERNDAIKQFNSGKEKIIICNSKAGGVGISLHDTIGDHPRMTLISPTWSAQDLLQVLGRTHRSKAQTDTIQKIVFCNKTYEMEIAKIIAEKIKNISYLNDGIPNTYTIKNMINGVPVDPEADETNKTFLYLETLYAKKKRLEEEIKETDEEIVKVKQKINEMFQ